METVLDGVRSLPVISDLRLVTERYVTETEILMKAGDSGRDVRFVNIRTIYGENDSHFRLITDVTLITAYVISYAHIKWFIEGLTSKRPNTYTSKGYLGDVISSNKVADIAFQTLTGFTALPASVFFLFEYILLSPLIRGNFASVRKLGCSFTKITLATQMLPVTLVVAIIEKFAGKMGCRVNLLDGFIRRFYPHLWHGLGARQFSKRSPAYERS